MNTRFTEIDILKAMAIILIVFCHMDNHVRNNDLIQLIDGAAAVIGLSMFFFTSGFLLHHTSSDIHTIQDVKRFYIKKVLRIYPLYWVAIISLIVVFGFLQVSPGNVDPYDFSENAIILHLLGLQGLFPYWNLHSMWFVGSILLLYFVFPLIVHFSSSPWSILKPSIAIISILIILNHIFGIININVIYYYPIFLCGILIDRLIYSTGRIMNLKFLKKLLNSSLIVFITFSMIIIISISYYKGIPIPFTPILIVAIIPFCIFCMVFIHLYIRLSRKPLATISLISSGTFAIYLFHHQFLSVFTWIIDQTSLSSLTQDVVIMTMGFSGAILFGIVVQQTEKLFFRSHLHARQGRREDAVR